MPEIWRTRARNYPGSIHEMSDFLSGALSQAKADLSLKRSAGTLYGKSTALEKSANSKKPKKEKWLNNRGAVLRAKRDGGRPESGLSDYDLERSRKAMERKEKEYKKMYNRGTDMALTGDAAENLLIDFDRKWAEGHRQEESDEEEEDPDDPLIEVEDEFGRTRQIRESEALRHEKPEVINPRPANLIYGRHLQTFNVDAQRKDEIWAEEEAGREVHYDPNFEIRQRGAGYINLGRGKDRSVRMDNLDQARSETVSTRLDRGMDGAKVAVKESQVDADDPEFLHPSRRMTEGDQKSEAEKNADRARIGGDFLDSLL
jgi:hypothetical protein